MGKGWLNIHELVQAMDPAERGYFKKYVAGFRDKEQSGMIALFDTLVKMPVLNEELIYQKFNQQPNQLKSVRTHLSRQVMNSLHAFRGDNNIGKQLRSALDTIELLHEKGLQNQSLALLQKSLLKAEQHQMHPYQILLLHKWDQLNKGLPEEKRFFETTAVSDKVLTVLHNMQRKEKIRKAHVKSIYWSNVFMPLRDESIAAESRLLLNELLTVSEEAITDFAERNLLYAAISNIYLMHDEIENAIVYQESTIKLMESLDLRAMNKLLSYVAALYNLASLMVQAGKPENVRNILDIIATLAPKSEYEKKFMHAVICFIKAVLLRFESRNVFNYQAFSKIKDELGVEMVIPSLYFDTNFALLVYALQHAEYEKAQDMAFDLLNAPYLHSQVSMQVHVRLLHILIHYKLQHAVLLPSLVRHTYRYMRKQNLKYKVELSILHFFKQLLLQVDKQTIERRFLDLHAELKGIAMQTGEGRVLHMYFNYIEWLEKELN